MDLTLADATRQKILQRIQNNAARIYSSRRKTEHISPVLRELHWLPVAARIKFKMGVLVYKALHIISFQNILVTFAFKLASFMVMHCDQWRTLNLPKYALLLKAWAIGLFRCWQQTPGIAYQLQFVIQTLLQSFVVNWTQWINIARRYFWMMRALQITRRWRWRWRKSWKTRNCTEK